MIVINPSTRPGDCAVCFERAVHKYAWEVTGTDRKKKSHVPLCDEHARERAKGKPLPVVTSRR